MPWTDTQPPLPFAGKTQTSRHCSHQAAVSAATTRHLKQVAYLSWLGLVQRATDWQAADHFRWPLSSVCSIRNGLVDRGLVAAVGFCDGKYGKRVTIWGPKL